MDDLISRRAAIDELNFSAELLRRVLDDTDLVGAEREKYEWGLGLIESCISNIKDLAPAPRWTPVSEGLPKVNGRYLVTRGLHACGPAMWNRVYLINYSDLMGLKSEKIWWDGNIGKSDFERIDDVIAWMERPEPWKGEI